MKSTGIIRRIDELGRVVIPKEIRRCLGIRDGESLEIYVDEEKITLSKHLMTTNITELIDKLGDLASSITRYNIAITDREKIIYCSNKLFAIDDNKSLSKKLIELIDLRLPYRSDTQEVISFGHCEINGFFNVMPIIAANDSIGLIIVYSKTRLDCDADILGKLLAKIISEKIDIV